MRLRGQPAAAQQIDISQDDALPPLPHGSKQFYQRTLPAVGADLVGWPIMALFAEHDEQPYSEQRWHEGLVVRFDGESEHPYLTFFETDSVWEPMDLPDVTVAFRSGKRADVCIAVCESMLPGDDDLTSV